MQLCLGQYNTSIDVKAAEGKLAGPMIKNGLTTAVSKHKSVQDCYIPCSKDCVLTAVISKNSIKLRCLVLTLIAIPLDAQWIRLQTLLHLVDGNSGKRILASRSYVHNVDSKLLCASPKVLNQVRCKGANQTQEQHPESLQSVAKVKLIFGPKLQQWFKKFASLREKEARGISILGKAAPISQQSSGLFCSINSLTSNFSELDIDSSESYTKQTKVKNGSEYVRSGNNGAIAVVNKEGSPGFNLPRSCVAETLLVSRCGPILTCEFFSAPNSSADNFNVNSVNGVDINTCGINSLTTLSQLANNAEVFEARSTKTFASHLCSDDSLLGVGDCKSDRFKCNPRYVDIDTCQTNSVTTLTQLANGPKVLEARNRQYLPRHDLCRGDSFKICSALLSIRDSETESLETNVCIKDQLANKHTLNTVWKNSILNSQIKEPLILQSGIIDRNCRQPLYSTKVKSEEHVFSHTIGNCPDQISTDNKQIQLDQSVNVGVASFAGQSGSRDGSSQRNVNSNTDCKSEMTIGSGLPSSYSITNPTDAASSSLTKGSDAIFHGTGDGFSRNCNKDSGRRHTDRYSSNSRKAKEKGIDDDEKVGHRNAAGQSREASSELHKSRRAKSTVEHSFVRGTKCSGNSTTSESSSCGSTQSIGSVYGYGTVAKGNNLCVWKKVQKHHEDGHLNEPKTTGHVQLISAKEQVRSLTTTTPVLPKFSLESNSWIHNCEEQYKKKPEDDNEHNRLQGDTDSDAISNKPQVELPKFQLAGESAGVPLLPSRAKEKQNTGKVKSRATKTGKAMWARKTGSSTMDDSKPYSQREDVDISQQSICSKSINSETEETRIGSHSTPDGYGYTMQVSRDSCSSVTSVNIHSSFDQTHIISGTSKSVGQEMLETKLPTNQTSSSGQAPGIQVMVDEGLFHPPPWKVRATTITGKGLSCERNNERHRSSQQVAQKWVPVESKSVKASATDKAVADSHSSTVICRMADEVRNKEDDSSGLSQASSADTQIRDSSAKTNVPGMALRDSQSHTQSKILGCPLNALKETDTSNSDHTEHAVPETSLDSDAACMRIGNDSRLLDESNKKAHSILKSIDSSYEYQMMSEHITQAIGSPIAEFEKVLDAMSPVVVQVPDKQTYNSDSTLLNKSLICNCQIPDIPLKSIWQWYEEPGNYGIEVKARDLEHSARLGIDGDLFRAYFVPFLSGMQLYGFSTASSTNCMGVQNSAEMVRNTMYGNLPILSTLLPKPTIADDSTVSEYLGPSSDLCTHCENHVCNCDATSDNIYSLFEFFECEQPHQRRPMFEKIKELTRSVDSSSQHFGNPCILNSLKIGDLHPASWFAVAWYPIYRVPEGQLRAAFLTYHSLGRFNHRNSCCNPVGGTSLSIVAPAVGLQSYSGQAECWFHLRKSYGNFPIERLPSDPSEIMQGRLRTLEETAASMSRGLTKTETPLQRSKHSDYDFFVGRRR